MTKELFQPQTISVNTAYMGHVLSNLNIFSKEVNQVFIPACLSSGIIPTIELLQKAMVNPNTLRDVIVSKIESGIKDMGVSGDLLRTSLMDSAKPIIDRLNKAISHLKNYDDQLGHLIFLNLGQGINIPQHIEIDASGKAGVSEEAKKKIVDIFTFSIQTERQQTAYDLLQGIANSMNEIISMSEDIPEFNIDENYFERKEGRIQVNPSVINFF